MGDVVPFGVAYRDVALLNEGADVGAIQERHVGQVDEEAPDSMVDNRTGSSSCP
jgi:hypothetical protein